MTQVTAEPIAACLARYAVGERFEALAPEPVHHIKRALIDWFGVALAGAREAPVTILQRALADSLDRGGARLLSGRPAAPRAAAFLNATAAHALELDDIFRDGLYHPGAPVIAAALAAGEAAGIDGRRLLVAVLAGYEVSTRVATAINPIHYRYWHTTGTVGCVGAAVGAAVALGCDWLRTAHALSTATSFTSGLQQAFRSSTMTKALHAGHAADTGVWAALAAAEGLTGALDILEGDAGFGCAMGGSPDWRLAFADLGRRYNVLDITFKDYACCGQTFAAIDGVMALRDRYRIDPTGIKRIVVGVPHETLDLVSDPAPHDGYKAKFSLRYVVASMLLYGDLRLAAFEPSRVWDKATRELMSRVDMEHDMEAQSRFPQQRCARVRILMADDSELEHFQTTRRGDPDWPLSDADLEAKFDELVAPVLGGFGAKRLRDQIWCIDACPDIRRLAYADRSTQKEERRTHG